jgi:hypothetical protein
VGDPTTIQAGSVAPIDDGFAALLVGFCGIPNSQIDDQVDTTFDGNFVSRLKTRYKHKTNSRKTYLFINILFFLIIIRVIDSLSGKKGFNLESSKRTNP